MLAGCNLGASQPTTPQPIIIFATPAPTANATTAAETTTANAEPVRSGEAPAVVEPVAGGSKGTITFAFDAFPSYYPGLLMHIKGLLAQHGYNLEIVPLQLGAENSLTREEQYSKIKSGEWDVQALTLDEVARLADPSIGAITAIINESAGADKLLARPEIATINDLRGKKIAFAAGTAGEFFLYYALSLVRLTPSDVTLVPMSTNAEAVQAYSSGQVDAVSAREPEILQIEEEGAKALIASDELRAIVDVLVTSRTAMNNKTESIQAFHDAWFEALKQMTDAPTESEQAIIEWGNNDWSFIAKEGDLNASLTKIAQATLSANEIAFRTPDTLITRLREAQSVYINAGVPSSATDYNLLVDGRFIEQTAQNEQLFSTKPPVNTSFLLAAQIEMPQLSETQQQEAQNIAQLPVQKIDFEPDSLRMTNRAAYDLDTLVVPALNASRLYLKIEGSSAWPGPDGRYSIEEIRAFARERATSVATYLSQQGISSNRLIIETVDPTIPNCIDESDCSQDRFVRFTLIAAPGR
jgi:NitT/TauT family transport system substrate-binding protein